MAYFFSISQCFRQATVVAQTVMSPCVYCVQLSVLYVFIFSLLSSFCKGQTLPRRKRPPMRNSWGQFQDPAKPDGKLHCVATPAFPPWFQGEGLRWFACRFDPTNGKRYIPGIRRGQTSQ
jgi:hypothetical protein